MNESENSQARRFSLVSSFVCRQPPFTGGHPELECGPCTAEAQRAATLRQAAAELRLLSEEWPFGPDWACAVATEWEALAGATEVKP